ncbi:MAG: hypothetical protein KAS13_01980 [Candidatus Omnitrophica bacterium]|nr:hypothetical protein [Candidatus Omnitrophota bacterium]
MKIIIYLTIAIFLLFGSLSYSQSQWEQIRTEHFIVYFYTDNQEFAESVSVAAEEYYDTVAVELGYVRYSNFWKWDKRVKIYIYPDHNAYLLASHQQSWSHGMANYTQKYIMSYVWGHDFLDRLLVHEITHLIFRDFVGFKGEVPLWLDEGIAQWGEKNARVLRTDMVKKLAISKRLLSLDAMMQIDVRSVQNDNKVKVTGLYEDRKNRLILQLRGDELVNTYYLQAFSLVSFLMNRFGAEDFIVFSRQLRDGKTITEALQFAYPTQIRSIDQLEGKWREHILTQD